MLTLRVLWVAAISVAVSAAVFAQNGAVAIGSGEPVRLNALPESPVPSDPLELATGEVQVVQTPEQRAQVLQLLRRARLLSNVRAQPYDMKTTFTSFGQGANEGAWQMEDISPGAGLYRWTAQGNNYSVVNLYKDQVLYSTQPAGSVPLRIQQLRTAIFFAYLGPAYLQQAAMRTTSGSLNGAELSCALLSGRAEVAPATPGRRWEETEYCVDTKSGLLTTYSAAPGMYVLYDYSKAIQFHDHILPGKITMTEAGGTILEAQVTSVTDPSATDEGEANAGLFTASSGMTSIGVGPLMTPPWRFPVFAPSGAVTASSTIHPVIVHGILTPNGEVTDAEALQTSDSNLAEQALAIAKKWRGIAGNAPGATPQQHEVFINVKFVVAGS